MCPRLILVVKAELRMNQKKASTDSRYKILQAAKIRNTEMGDKLKAN